MDYLSPRDHLTRDGKTGQNISTRNHGRSAGIAGLGTRAFRDANLICSVLFSWKEVAMFTTFAQLCMALPRQAKKKILENLHV